MDMVLKLRELRRLNRLSQRDLADKSGVGEKTISSFETGQRIGSLKISQLQKILGVFGLTEREFFGSALERRLAPWEDSQPSGAELLDELRSLPRSIQQSLIGKFRVMVETASELHSIGASTHRGAIHEDADWQMLASRN